MGDWTIFRQEWFVLGLAALAVVIFFWLMKKLVKWFLILAIIGLCVWRFWLS